MSKFNFFTPYLAKQEKGNARFKKAVSIALLVLIFAAASSGFVFFRGMTIKSHIQTMEETLQQPDMQRKRVEMERYKNQRSLGNTYLQEIDKVEKNFQSIFVINVELMDKITSSLPPEVVFRSMKLSVNDLNIIANSTDWTSIAEFQYNLKKLGIYNNIHVDSISRGQNTPGYAFTLTGNYNGLGSDQNDAE